MVPVCQFQLDTLPGGGLVGAQLERPSDFDAVGKELSTVKVDVMVVFREKCPGFGTGAVELGREYHFGSAVAEPDTVEEEGARSARFRWTSS